MDKHEEITPALLDTRGAARLLGVSKSYLEHDRVRPCLGIPYIRLGGAVRYDPAAVLAWARSKTVNAAPQPAPEAQPEPPRRRGRPRKAI